MTDIRMGGKGHREKRAQFCAEYKKAICQQVLKCNVSSKRSIQFVGLLVTRGKDEKMLCTGSVVLRAECFKEVEMAQQVPRKG